MMDKPPHSFGFSLPFYLSGSVKLLYDFFIWIFYQHYGNKSISDPSENYKGVEKQSIEADA
jgi:hypothetical protein